MGLYIPAGFAHAYYSYEKENIIYYKLNNYYSPKYESGIIYNDKTIKIKWPKKMKFQKKIKICQLSLNLKKNLKIYNLFEV